MVSDKVTNFIKTLHMNRARGIGHIPVRAVMEMIRVSGMGNCIKMGEKRVNCYFRQGGQRKYLREENI